MEFDQFLYGACFDELDGNILLLIAKNSGMLNLPGGRVPSEFLEKAKDERWRRDFLASKLSEQIGLDYAIKNGGAVPLIESIQPIPATYNVDTEGCKQRHSVIIIGDVNYNYVRNPLAAFYDYRQFIENVKEGRVTREQELLILRVFASRDYPNRGESRRAGQELDQKHK